MKFPLFEILETTKNGERKRGPINNQWQKGGLARYPEVIDLRGHYKVRVLSIHNLHHEVEAKAHT